MNKKIGIIGSGSVAQALGTGFLKYGHEVMLGTRNVSKLDEWTTGPGKGSKVGGFTEAAAFGEIIVLAVKGSAAAESLKMAGEANINGKIIMDATNPIADTPPENGVLRFFTSLDNSLMEQLQKEFVQARFVKAFNCIGSHFMVNPPFKTQPTMFICGNDQNAKKEVDIIISKFGFDVADMGGAEAARAIEPLCILWCIPGLLKNEWSHAFKLLKNT